MIQALRPDGTTETIETSADTPEQAVKFINSYRGLRVTNIQPLSK